MTINNLLTDVDYLKVKTLVNKFNPIKVLGVEKSENRHSNVIAWLLNPESPHELKDNFLNLFLKSVLHKNDCFSEYEEYLTDELKNIKIIREWQYKSDKIDIVGISKKNNFVFIIENKLESKQKDGQLKKYINHIKEVFPDYKILPIFFTLDYESPNEDYYVYSYDNFYHLLNSFSFKDKAISNFIDSYKEAIEELIVVDTEIVLLCQTLFKKYSHILNSSAFARDLDLFDQEALSAIKNNHKSRENRMFKRAVRKFYEHYRITEDGGFSKDESSNISKDIYYTSKEFWFMNSIMLANEIKKITHDKIPESIINGEITDKKWKSFYPVSFKFLKNGQKLTLYLLCGPEPFLKEYYPENNLQDLSRVIKENNDTELMDCDFRGDYPYIIAKHSTTINNWTDLQIIFNTMRKLYLEFDGGKDVQEQTILFGLKSAFEVLNEKNAVL
ncbi:PD-(D/E)XK nuclease family protein [Bacillus cereus]|uniref:PDDEXK-like family protein n=1 Tax=Bacillus cereus TaxID=1396 RepID=UPI003D65E148